MELRNEDLNVVVDDELSTTLLFLGCLDNSNGESSTKEELSLQALEVENEI